MSSTDDVQALEEQLAQLSITKTEDDLSIPVFDKTIPSFEPFTNDPQFLDLEFNSPIALVNNKFFETEFEKDAFASIRARAQLWAEGVKVTSEQTAEMEKIYLAHVEAFNAQPEPQFDRMFIRDGERSFNTPCRRAALCHVLTFLQSHTLKNDYHQGLSMIVSFLLCFLPTPTVLAMVVAANDSMTPDMWKSQSVFAVTDGYVLMDLLAQHYPLIAAKFKAEYVIPEMYISKYWCAFAVHLLPLQSLAILFDQFWAQDGVLALFRCVLTVIASHEAELLECKDVVGLMRIMSLDHKFYDPNVVNTLIYGLNNTEEQTQQQADFRAKVEMIVDSLRDDAVLTQLRTHAYTVNILPRVAAAERDFAKDVTPDCKNEACANASEQGFYFCLDCKIHLCEDCAYSSWEGHNDDDHEVRTLDDLDDE